MKTSSHRARAVLRAAPGFLVLARGAAAGVRVHADRPLLPRGLHGRCAGLLWVLVTFAWPEHLEQLGEPGQARARSMIPTLVVFAYLAAALYIGIFAFRSSRGRRFGGGLLPRRPIARAGGVPAVAVRRQHDRVLDPRRLGPRLRQRHRDVRVDGVLVGADHSAAAVLCRHAVVGARSAQRLHHAGADVPRPLGMRATSAR